MAWRKNSNLTQKGFSGDGFFCSDLDECALRLSSCPENSSCNNTFGSYDCTCDSGFELGNDDSCQDINECLKPGSASHVCSYEPEGICTNTIGSYTCSCPQGMGGSGTIENNYIQTTAFK